MKNTIYTFLLVLLIGLNAHAQVLREWSQQAFKMGESLDFKASYGIIDAAKINLSIAPKKVEVGKRNTFHIIGTGKSLGAFSWFFKVDDRYETYIDDKAIIPWIFIRRVHEGGYQLKRNIYFNHYQDKAVVKELKNDSKTTYEIQKNSQDLLSAFYYARTLDLQAATVGQEFVISTFFDKENYPLKIKFVGREKVKTDLGEFTCLKFNPMLQEGRVFKEQEDMTIWISDDQNKVPIRLQTNLLIGSLKIDLHQYSGLMAPLVGKLK